MAFAEVWEKRMRTDKLTYSAGQRRHVQERTQSQALPANASRLADERKRKEALPACEEKCRLLFDSTRDAVFVHDEQARMLAVNQRAVERLGYTRAELMAMNVNQLHSETESLHWRDLMAKVMGQGYLIFETEHQCKDGSSIPTEVSACRIVWDDKPAIISICRDNTERKRVEAETARLGAQHGQLQKAESLDRMAGAIAHNFNNLIGTVMGNLELAMIGTPGEAGHMNNLAEAMKAASRAAEVSSLMLTYVGQNAGQQQNLDLSEACRRSLPLLRVTRMKEDGLEVDLPGSGPIIQANADQIQQLLINLITNAREAQGEGGGAIRLAVKTVAAADIPARHRFPMGWQSQCKLYACLEVSDSGCGIAEKNMDELFDPFYTSKFTGRGLGLSVVLGVVRAHNGAVTVESEVGCGSALRVFFPVSSEAAPRPAAEPVDGNPEFKGGGTILLAEDDPEVREMTKAMIVHLGFSVLEAGDGVEALEVFRQNQDTIMCVLSDLTMPRMDGWETLTAVRQLVPDMPVILASGYDQANVMAGEHAEWPQAFLSKPYGTKGVRDALKKALGSHLKGATSSSTW
jgi:two-component system, cell cycle sensor histidine kinase and response regulator CckA